MVDEMKEIKDLIVNVCKEENLQVTINNSIRNSLIAGTGAFIGCLLFGPGGGVPGAGIGSALAFATGENYKPLWQVFNELPEETKQDIAEKVRDIKQRTCKEAKQAFKTLATEVVAALKREIANFILDYFRHKIGLKVDKVEIKD